MLKSVFVRACIAFAHICFLLVCVVVFFFSLRLLNRMRKRDCISVMSERSLFLDSTLTIARIKISNLFQQIGKVFSLAFDFCMTQKIKIYNRIATKVIDVCFFFSVASYVCLLTNGTFRWDRLNFCWKIANSSFSNCILRLMQLNNISKEDCTTFALQNEHRTFINASI